ncbi:MAG: CDP-diacylglycerol--serine O-phosphatidyltransferase [Vicinamibacterales bacterium]
MSKPPRRVRLDRDERRMRRGMYLLPSLFTIGNLFCGYACIMFAMRGDLTTAAPFIGIALVLDSLDGRIARLTGTTSAFGIELDSLADVVSFGLAPAVLASAWGLSELGRWGWAAGFLYVTAAAIRLARFNINTETHTDKRYFVGMPSPAAASVPAATIFFYPYPLVGRAQAMAAIAVVLLPAILMVSSIRFRSFKNLNLGWDRSYFKLFVFAALLVFIAEEPRWALVIITYTYLTAALIEWTLTRWRNRRSAPLPEA